MDQFDSNVQKVMDFLTERDYSSSHKSLHKVCYRQFQAYLLANQKAYSYEEGISWVEMNTPDWTDRVIKGYKHCLLHLHDVYTHGNVMPEHLHPQHSYYPQLYDPLKMSLDEYIHSIQPDYAEKYISSITVGCARFLLFLQKRKITCIENISYEDMIAFHIEDIHQSQKTKDRSECDIRRMLRYFSCTKQLSAGYSLILNKQFLHQIIQLSDLPGSARKRIQELRGESMDFPASEFRDAADGFQCLLEGYRYSSTIRKCSKHVLTLLFLFLDMHGLGYMPEISWIWFENAKPLLLSNWKMHRRTLKLFEEFTQNGDVQPEKVYRYKQNGYEQLPDWCREVLGDFLELKHRENMRHSTIDMYRSSNTRFCSFLEKEGLQGFEELTPEHLKQFHLTDPHSTLEGKNAYNVRIRNFIIYLEEEGTINNQMLHLALPCTFAPREGITEVLTNEEKECINSFQRKAHGASELRDSAMLQLGLKMGLRGSDIVNLQFSDIDWKMSTIHLIQVKTLSEELLPMPVTVGNAVFRYITQGRPDSTSPYIFIHHRVPYGKLNPGVCRKSLKKALPGRNVPGSGFHVTRKSFATALLNKGIGMDTIVDSLGHRSDSTVKKYLSLDEERMRACPLSLSEVNISLKGGLSGC